MLIVLGLSTVVLHHNTRIVLFLYLHVLSCMEQAALSFSIIYLIFIKVIFKKFTGYFLKTSQLKTESAGHCVFSQLMELTLV